MEKENHKQICNYKILTQFEDLSLVRRFVELSMSAIIYDEFEIEPFVEFSVPFQAAYWYIKYHILKDNEFKLSRGDQETLYAERNLNIIWLKVKNEHGTVIECKDGDWFIQFLKVDFIEDTLLQSLRITAIEVL